MEQKNDILYFDQNGQPHVKTAPSSLEEEHKRKTVSSGASEASSVADINAPIAERPAINFVERLNQHLSELETAVDAFQNDNGKVAAELQAANAEVSRINSELFHAEKRLAELHAKGSALQQYSAAAGRIEGDYQRTLTDYSDAVSADVIRHIFGRDIPIVKLSSDRRAELKLHAKVDALRQFTFIPRSDLDRRAILDESTGNSRIVNTIRVERTNQRVDAVCEKLVALRTYIEKDSAK